MDTILGSIMNKIMKTYMIVLKQKKNNTNHCVDSNFCLSISNLDIKYFATRNYKPDESVPNPIQQPLLFSSWKCPKWGQVF